MSLTIEREVYRPSNGQANRRENHMRDSVKPMIGKALTVSKMKNPLLVFKRVSRKLLLPFLLLACILCRPVAAEVAAIRVESKTAGREFPVIVTLPSDYQASTGRYACIYMLHCAGADEGFWNRVVDMQAVADHYKRIIVAPSTGPYSWYVDYEDKNHTETFITKELIPYIDKTYRSNGAKRWIAGFSMGGYGALYLGLRHPDLFSASGSMGGGIKVSQWDNNWGLNQAMGPAEERKIYDLFSPHMIKSLKSEAPPLVYMVCGTRDFFYAENLAAHKLLEADEIAHQWQANDGGHGDYLPPSLLKILRYFQTKDRAADTLREPWQHVGKTAELSEE